jgi:hypothetical protein
VGALAKFPQVEERAGPARGRAGGQRARTLGLGRTGLAVVETRVLNPGATWFPGQFRRQRPVGYGLGALPISKGASTNQPFQRSHIQGWVPVPLLGSLPPLQCLGAGKGWPFREWHTGAG